MNFWSAQVSSRFWSSLLIALAIFFIAGCKVEDKTWIDKMLSEMETAWIEADKSGLGQEGREVAMNLVAQKYFRPGMPKVDAFKLLSDLKMQGFDIGEYRHEGARDWPNGKLKPYMDDATRRNFQRQIAPGFSRVIASKQYGKVNFVILKSAGITITVSDSQDGIISINGAVGLNSL